MQDANKCNIIAAFLLIAGRITMTSQNRGVYKPCKPLDYFLHVKKNIGEHVSYVTVWTESNFD